MVNIYLARHGQDEDNARGLLNGRRDNPLTQKGIEQAESVGKRIRESGIKFDKIYSSPLKRALDTARIISASIGGPEPEAMEDLIERDFGIMTGKPYSSIIEMCAPDILESEDIAYFLGPEGAETFPRLMERGRKVIDGIKGENDRGNILLVTHGDVGKMIYAAFYGLDWKKVLKDFYFGNADILLLSEGSPAEDARAFGASGRETEKQKAKTGESGSF